MATIERSALIPVSAETLYRMVNDVECYPSYMAGCVGAEVLEQSDRHMVARLDLKKGGISQSFTTRNRLTPHQRIELSLEEGPFKSFAGRWEFTPLSDSACKVTFTLEFVLSSRVLSMAAKRLFNGVADNLVDALVKRAGEKNAAK